MIKLIITTLLTLLAVALASPGVTAQSANVEVKVLATPMDPTEGSMLVGRAAAGGMIIQLELEAARPMWMAASAKVQMEKNGTSGEWMLLATPPIWSEHAVKKGELYHIAVKPIDPKSKSRISHANVKFKAVNISSRQTVQSAMHAMWHGGGLHYGLNSALAGDGTYQVTVTVEPPTFARELKDKDRWMKPAVAKFHFRLVGGKITEVSVPETP